MTSAEIRKLEIILELFERNKWEAHTRELAATRGQKRRHGTEAAVWQHAFEILSPMLKMEPSNGRQAAERPRRRHLISNF